MSMRTKMQTSMLVGSSWCSYMKQVASVYRREDVTKGIFPTDATYSSVCRHRIGTCPAAVAVGTPQISFGWAQTPRKACAVIGDEQQRPVCPLVIMAVEAEYYATFPEPDGTFLAGRKRL